MSRKVYVMRGGGDYVCLAIATEKRQSRIFLTEDQAQHLSNRLQSFAKGGYGAEMVAEENEF